MTVPVPNDGAMGALSAQEKSRLEELEKTIESGMAPFVAVGTALLEIRDEKLFRESYPNFETYCQERWNVGRIRAHQLIKSAETMCTLKGSSMLTSGEHTDTPPVDNSPLPTNERQARELARVPKEDQPKVWQKVVETAPQGKVTARRVQQVVDEQLGTANAEPQPEPSVPVDELGIPLEGKMIGVFRANEKFDEVMHHLRKAAKLMNELSGIPGGEHLRHELSAKISGDTTIFRSLHLDNAKNQVNQTRPYAATCGYCHQKHPGRFDKGCRGCYGLGWNTKSEWERTPGDYREAALAAAKKGDR
jgi:hypothetical protein